MNRSGRAIVVGGDETGIARYTHFPARGCCSWSRLGPMPSSSSWSSRVIGHSPAPRLHPICLPGPPPADYHLLPHGPGGRRPDDEEQQLSVAEPDLHADEQEEDDDPTRGGRMGEGLERGTRDGPPSDGAVLVEPIDGDSSADHREPLADRRSHAGGSP